MRDAVVRKEGGAARRGGLLLACLALAMGLLFGLPGQALAQQQENGTAPGQLVVTLQGSQDDGGSDDSVYSDSSGSSDDQGAQDEGGGSAQTGDVEAALAILFAVAGLALAAAGARTACRARRRETVRGAEMGLPASVSKSLTAAVALTLAALLLFGLSARSALAADDASKECATVSAAMTISEDGTVVSADATFKNQSASRLTITGVTVPELGGDVSSDLVGTQVEAKSEVNGGLSVDSVPDSVVQAAKEAGGTVKLDMTADYTYDSYTVTFVANGGSDVNPEQVAQGECASKPDVPTHEGDYVFVGWYSDKELTTAFDFDSSIEGDTTVYAAWSLKFYSISFHAGKHGSDPSKQSVQSGSSAEEPSCTDDAYHVVGWYDNEDLSGKAYDFSSAVTGDLDLYAKWEINTYKVSFDVDGGEPAPKEQTVEYGKKASEPKANPAKDGFVFKGWYSDSGFVVETDFDQAVTMDTTLYAKWAEAVTVKFDLAYEGAKAIDDATVEKGVAIGELPKPERKGYKFAGWYFDGSDDPVTSETTFDEGATLTAKWTESATTYTVELYEQKESGEGYLDEPTITETVEGVTGQPTAYEAPTYEGYKANDFEQATIKADGSTTLKIYYDRNVYDVRFYVSEDDKATGKDPYKTMQLRYDAHATKPADPENQGYTLTGWYLLQGNGDGSKSKRFIDWDTDTMGVYEGGLDLYADWAAIKDGAAYTVESEFQQVGSDGKPSDKYVVNDNLIYTLYGTAGEKTSVEARTYTGYNAQEVEQVEIKGEGTVVTVKYDLKTADVSFEANGHGSGKTIKSVACGASLKNLAPSLSENGYVFNGWFRDKDFTQPFDLANDVMGESDLTLYAKWTAATDTKYTVRHLQQDVSGDDYALVETETLTGTTGEKTAAVAKSYSDFVEPAVTQREIAADGSTVVDVKYDRMLIDVNVTMLDGSTATQSVRSGAKATEPEASTEVDEDGFCLDGWLLKSEQGDTTFDFSTPITSDIATGGVVTIVAKKSSVTDSYWIAPASSITTSNSSVQVANADYTNPESGIVKTRVQIQADVKKIAAGDDDVIVEYQKYMTNDNYHLYTKVGTGTSTNDYAEFRIVHVGSHDDDGSSLTFQATSAVAVSSMNASSTNEGGWEASSLRTSLNSGSIYSKLNSELVNDVMPVAKKSLSPKSTSWVYVQSLSSTSDKFWLPSYSEVYSDAESLTSSTRGAFESQFAYEGSQYAYYKNIGIEGGANTALSPLTKYRDGAAGGDNAEAWLRTPYLDNSGWFGRVASDGRASSDANINPCDAAFQRMVAPCFSFGDASTHTVKFVTNGGSAVDAQQVTNGTSVTEATTTQDGKEFVGWYTDAALTKPFVLGTTIVTADTVLYARWTEVESSVTGSYWLAPSYKYTNGNSLAAVNNVYNADCELNPQGHVIKDRAQILFDKSRLYAGDKAATVEYTYYMLTDTVHLYSKARSEGTADDFNEFRIVNVGAHDGDNSALTFQMSTAYKTTSKIGWEWDHPETPYDTLSWGFRSSNMCYYFKGNAKYDIGAKLYSDIRTVNKTYGYGQIGGYTGAGSWLANDDMPVWLASVSEMVGRCNEKWGGQLNWVLQGEGSQYQYFKWHGAKATSEDDENGTIKSMTESRSGDDFSDSDCDSDYCLWARSVTPNAKAMRNYMAFTEDGGVSWYDCYYHTSYDLSLCYSPCFCF